MYSVFLVLCILSSVFGQIRVVAECGAPFVACNTEGAYGFSIEVWRVVYSVSSFNLNLILDSTNS